MIGEDVSRELERLDSASFEDLRDFMDRLDKLGRTRLFRTGSEVSLTLEWKQGQPLEATTKEPDEDTLNAFVMVLRPILLESERTSLRRVFNLCDRHLVEPSLRERTWEIRREWRSAQRVGVFKFVHNDEEWQPERLAHLILNAYYAHDDREKRQQLAHGQARASLVNDALLRMPIRGVRIREIARPDKEGGSPWVRMFRSATHVSTAAPSRSAPTSRSSEDRGTGAVPRP
jgi:hypothetical protein